MQTVPVAKAQAALNALTNRCKYEGESFTITKGKKAVPFALLSPVGGPESHEKRTDAVGPSSKKVSRLGAGPDGSNPANVSARSQPNRKRRPSAE